MKQFHGWRTQLNKKRRKLSSVLNFSRIRSPPWKKEFVFVVALSRSSCRLCIWLWARGFLEIGGKLVLIMSSLYMAVIARGFLEICGKLALIMSSLYMAVIARGFLSRLIICCLSAPEDWQPNCLVCWQIGWERSTEGGHWLWSSRGEQLSNCFRFFV